jgi:hypothetical protein
MTIFLFLLAIAASDAPAQSKPANAEPFCKPTPQSAIRDSPLALSILWSRIHREFA